MAGARIGYALATAEIIATFDKIRLHFGVNRVAQAGALASLQDTAHLESVVTAVAEGREEYATLARDLGFTPLPSATNFVTMDVEASSGRVGWSRLWPSVASSFACLARRRWIAASA